MVATVGAPEVTSGRRAPAVGLVCLLAALGCRRDGFEPSREFYVSPAGDDRGDCARARNPASPRRTLKAVLACARPGDTVTLHDGRYEEHVASWPSGAAGRYLTIRAARDGGAILAVGLQLHPGNAYLTFEGLRLHGGQKTVTGHHLRFFRNEWRGACPSTNCGTVVIGAIEAATTADVLFEDNWFHGAGGRANIKAFNASRVVVRRAIVRHDGGWASDRDEELVEAAVILHNSREVILQDVLVLDSSLGYHAWRGAFVVQKDASSATPTRNLRFQGILALDPAAPGFQVLGGGLIDNLRIERSIFMGGGDGVLLGRGSLQSARLSEVMVIRQPRGGSDAAATGVGFSGTGRVVLERAQVTGYSRALVGVSAERVDRAPVEPVLARRHGKAGSAYGETGWDQPTPVPLWPWPAQERIQRELCPEAGVSRGLCGAPCLSDYVLTRLGRPGRSGCSATADASIAGDSIPPGGDRRDAASPERTAPSPPELAGQDLITPACPPAPCLPAGGTRANPPLDELGTQWGAFTLEAKLDIAAGTDASVSLAEQPPLPGETPPVVVRFSADRRVRPERGGEPDPGFSLADLPAGPFRLRLEVDVPAAAYAATLIAADGGERQLGRQIRFASAARSLGFVVVTGRTGGVSFCRTALTRPACFSTTGQAAPARFGFAAQAGSFVARARVRFSGLQDGWLGLGGRTAVGAELTHPIAQVLFDARGKVRALAGENLGESYERGGSYPVRLPVEVSVRSLAALLVDRWEAQGPAGWLEVCGLAVQVPRCVLSRSHLSVRPRQQSFCPQRSPFTALARLVPAPGRLDGAVGLASGTVSEWNNLGPIVRFSPAGVIDVNDGPGYLPSSLPYQSGQAYLVRMVVDPVARRYDAFVTMPGGREHTLGRRLRFRNQHLERFDAFALPVDIGELSACDLMVRR